MRKDYNEFYIEKHDLNVGFVGFFLIEILSSL